MVGSIVSAASAHAQVAVTTHHYDIARTGWDRNEPTLSYAAMANHTAGQAFGLLQNIPLDAQVDAQPLVMPNAIIDGDPNLGTHDVVFIVTEQNTVYAIDPLRGTVLNSRNLGAGIAYPLNCQNGAWAVGIGSTPVIDPVTNSLYVITYTNAAQPTYTVHRLALHDFSDVTTPQIVAATHPLTDGSTFTFNATYQRQRSALLLIGGSVYAGFSSFCDMGGDQSRGWLLGWNATTLAPLPVIHNARATLAQLDNTLPPGLYNFYLSSIWMSGAGIAADRMGNLFFVTGNSGPGNYTGTTNIQESAVAFSRAQNVITSLFTPYNVADLDNNDVDFGSGGIMLLPHAIVGLPPRLAVAAGKDGWMFLMNRDSLGGYQGPNGPDQVIGRVQIGGCWCAPSYFERAGLPQIVSSGGQTIQVWSLSSTGTALQPGPQAQVVSGQDLGFFTTVSSYGDTNPVIWAVAKPTGVQGSINVSLLAFAAYGKPGPTMAPLYAATAGTWPNTGANANIVPVVANGLVYVASYRQLAVFGLGGHSP